MPVCGAERKTHLRRPISRVSSSVRLRKSVAVIDFIINNMCIVIRVDACYTIIARYCIANLQAVRSRRRRENGRTHMMGLKIYYNELHTILRGPIRVKIKTSFLNSNLNTYYFIFVSITALSLPNVVVFFLDARPSSSSSQWCLTCIIIVYTYYVNVYQCTA